MKCYDLEVAGSDFIQNIFRIGSKRNSLNKKCAMRSRKKSPLRLKQKNEEYIRE